MHSDGFDMFTECSALDSMTLSALDVLTGGFPWKLVEIVAVVIIWRPISSVCGLLTRFVDSLSALDALTLIALNIYTLTGLDILTQCTQYSRRDSLTLSALNVLTLTALDSLTLIALNAYTLTGLDALTQCTQYSRRDSLTLSALDVLTLTALDSLSASGVNESIVNDSTATQWLDCNTMTRLQHNWLERQWLDCKTTATQLPASMTRLQHKDSTATQLTRASMTRLQHNCNTTAGVNEWRVNTSSAERVDESTLERWVQRVKVSSPVRVYVLTRNALDTQTLPGLDTFDSMYPVP